MLSFGGSNDAFPDLSPDGREIVLTHTDGDAERLYVARWSPDGRSIAFSADRGIFLVSAAGGNPRRLTDTGGWPVWLPDGRQIAYLSMRGDGNQEIRTVPIDGGAGRTLNQIRFRGSNHPFAISPDGKWIGTNNAMHFSDEIWLLDAVRNP